MSSTPEEPQEAPQSPTPDPEPSMPPSLAEALAEAPKAFEELPPDKRDLVEKMLGGLGAATALEEAEQPPKTRRRRRRKATATEEPSEAPEPEPQESTPAVLSGTRRTRKWKLLETRLAELLAMPGVVFVQAGDEFCAAHFMVRGPQLADRLVTVAEGNEAVANLLTRIANGTSILSVLLALTTYILPPAIHHGLPVPEAVRNFYGAVPLDQPLNGTYPRPSTPPQA